MHSAQARRFGSGMAVLAGIVLLALSPTAAPFVHGQNTRIYLQSNNSTTGLNTVLGFSNDGTGVVTPLPGSPYPTLGTGTAGPFGAVQFDADGQVILNAAGTQLFAVNGHSNDISAFTVNADGSLTLVSGSPFPSGGPNPVSLGLKEKALPNTNFLVVANKNQDPLQTGSANYTTFKVASDGSLTMNAGSTYLPAGAPEQVLFRRGTQVQFFGFEFATNAVVTYALDRNGLMSKISSVTPPVANPQIQGGALHPAKSIIYIGEPVQRRVGVVDFDTAGKLTYMRDVENQGAAVCWVIVSADGKYLYDAETPSSAITVYSLANSQAPVQIQRFKVKGAGAGPANLALDPKGGFLYAVDWDATLHVLSVGANGTLTEPKNPISLNLPAGTIPLGIAVH